VINDLDVETMAVKDIVNEVLKNVISDKWNYDNIKPYVTKVMCKKLGSGQVLLRRRSSPTHVSPHRIRTGSPTKRRSKKKISKICPEGQEPSSKTGRCVKKCGPDQERNLITGRCRQRSIKRKSPSPPKRLSPKRLSPKLRTPSPKLRTPSPKISIFEDIEEVEEPQEEITNDYLIEDNEDNEEGDDLE